MKTMICIPCMDMVHTRFMRSLLLLDKVGDVVYGIHQGSLVYDSRNRLLEAATAENVDRLLWFDSDMEIPYNTMRLLSEDLDAGHEIVSGLYYKRKEPGGPVIYKECKILQMPPERLMPLATPYTDYPENSVFEVEAFGFGCVMMSADAVRTITEQYGKMPFMPVGGFGEDLSFCMRAMKAGVKLWCDSRVKLGHIGQKTIYPETGDSNK